MMRPLQSPVQTARRPRRSLSSARRGSVLIFVVVLLVLLALIGTAFISTARTDRYATQQNAYNTQIDLLAQGVQNMVANAAAGSLFGTNGVYRQAADTATGYHHRTDYKEDLWLADRVPVLITDSGNPTPGWTSLTFPLSGVAQFDDPITGIPVPLTNTKENTYGAINSLTFNGADVPALRLVDRSGARIPNPYVPGDNIFHAADADGDGIADSGYFKLPIGQVNGATWYAAVRIIDDNSAINVNTAWTATGDFDFAGTASTNLGLFRSNTGLMEFLRDYNPAGAYATFSPEWTAFNLWRFNTAGYAAQAPVDDTAPNGAARGDYNFISQGDALENQIARRLDWPGYQVVGTRYQAASYSDMLSLARNFVLGSTSNSDLEERLKISLTKRYDAVTPLRTQPYLPNRAYTTGLPSTDFWFNDNFDYASEVPGNMNTIKNLRALMVTRNPVSGLMPQQSMTVLPAEVKTPVIYPTVNFDLMPDYTAANLPEPHTSVNTAWFGELWRGFWSVMQDSSFKNGAATVLSTPYGTPEFATTPASPALPADMYTGSKFDASFNPPTPQTAADIHPYHMFRNSLRDPTAGGTGNTFLTPANQMLLRAALASINTIALREPTDKTAVGHDVIPSRDIVLRATVNGTPNTLVGVRVYGSKLQPFITEIYAQTDVVANPAATGPNPIGYVAVELFNPYSWPIDLKADGYKLTTLTRTPGGLAPTQALVIDFTAAAGSFVVPAGGYLLLENYNQAGGGTALYRPASSGLPATGPLPARTTPPLPAMNEAYVPGLEAVFNHEMVLVRPQDPASPPALLIDNVPCDSFDFTGLFPGITTAATAWHYARRNDSSNTWQFVYPGRYDGGQASQRQQGTQVAAAWDPSAAGVDPWETAPPAPSMTLGATAGAATSNDNPAATYPTTFTIQIQNQGVPGPNPLTTVTNTFPFGGFARNGDILQVPYIGAYRVTDGAGNLIEMNSITMDASFAEDADTTDDSVEQVGRFCPGLVTAPLTDNYAWASKLFDNLTAIQNPHDDYMPNVDPNRYTAITGQSAPAATPNGSVTTMAQANGGHEDTAPIHGLININTASWKVLSALPLVLNAGTGQVDRANTIQLAKDIVAYRQANGPFQSIFDLNKVTNFQNGMGSVVGNPGNALGDLTPMGSTDNVIDDFENKYLQINRISNLITTRSDAFTCYVLLQGWQNVGTPNATVVAERRFAFIVDRSAVTPTNGTPVVVPVPSN